jgi:hypothetical protein
MPTTSIWITAALRPKVEAALARARDDLLNDDELRGSPGEECLRGVDAIDALMEQLRHESPSVLGGVPVRGDLWELQDVAYSVMRMHVNDLSDAADHFWTGRIDAAELRTGLLTAGQYIDLVRTVGPPERPSCVSA